MEQLEITFIDDNQLELDFSAPVFKPKTLNELVDYYYDNLSVDVREHELRQLLKDDHGKGRFWERVLGKAMQTHTKLLKNNAWHKDFSDGSDAKFATSVRMTNGTFQATINNFQTKVGPLRVCLCVVGADIHKTYYMMIPHSYYSKLKHPMKITFSNFRPIGKIWEQFQCSWDDVISPI